MNEFAAGITISTNIVVNVSDCVLSHIRASGAGGQNVNKVSSAIHLRFDIPSSNLPDYLKDRLLALNDQRISRDGIVTIKAQEFRTQEKNRDAAYKRLQSLIRSVLTLPKNRVATKPTRSSKRRRLDDKSKRSKIKTNRKKLDW